jgi:uncharacterized iron-regulated membrane protein
MRARRWAVNVHKWVALVIGVQILLWIAGGVVMSVLPIEVVRGEHKVAERPPPAFAPAELLPLAGASAAAGLGALAEARLGTLEGDPVWRLAAVDGARTVVHARTGEVLSPFDARDAERLARAHLTLDAPVADVTRFVDAPDEYGGPLPTWRVRFDDTDATTVYVDAVAGRVTARRSTTWRVYDLFWRLHVMDYDDGADFNHPLIIGASAVALLVAISGLVLLVSRMRQSLRVTLATRRRRAAAGGIG